MYKMINRCRICGNEKLKSILDLGQQQLTGVFPTRDELKNLESGPLELVKCDGGCGLVQLRYSFEPEKMYGDNYGYHSGLNQSMVRHLDGITTEVKGRIELHDGDMIIDIGSNDGTLLGTWLDKDDGKKLLLVGMDPTGLKFKKFYKSGIELIPEFFSAKFIKEKYGDKKAKVITSIAMFYDLENPVEFAKNVADMLADDGIWVTEQSYMPLMVEKNSYDTICHEHLEFYSLKQISYIANHAGLKIIDVSVDDTNGGSFRITMAHKKSGFTPSDAVLDMKEREEADGVDEIGFFDQFVSDIKTHKKKVLEFLKKQKSEGKIVLGYGASTKGNVVLQYCGIMPDLLPAIAEVNEDKFGHVTPGTGIKIISESDAKAMKPDFFLVMPWHFKNTLLERENAYREESGCKFVFYLPKFEIV